MTGLREAHEPNADEPGARRRPPSCCYGMALLAEGGELKDPARFTRLLADRLAAAL